MLRSQLESNICEAKRCWSNALKGKIRLDNKRSAVVKKIQQIETEVDQARCDLTALIDRHADLLLQKLGSIKDEQLEDIDIEEKELDKHLDCLECVKYLAQTWHQMITMTVFSVTWQGS